MRCTYVPRPVDRRRPRAIDTYQRLLSLEFRSLTGIEAAHAAFSRILKPNPYAAFDVPNAPDNDDVLTLGTDQRDYFVPLVRDEAGRLTDGDAVFDIGDGPVTPAQSTAAMRNELKRNDIRVLAAQRHESRLYGNDLGDILALGFIADLGEMDDDARANRIAFIGEALFRHPERFDLALETDGIRAHILSVQQPQY